jgi:ubiquinone/menaquinone biosynthesis C-methylase UbiE
MTKKNRDTKGTVPIKRFEDVWRSRFERFAQNYEEEHLVSGWSDRGLQRRLELFCEILEHRKLPKPATVLDLGCGAGTYVRLLSGLGHMAVGLDYSMPSLERALAHDQDPQGRYIHAEAYRLPFRDGTFDLIAAIGVFQALGDPEKALDEMVRVLAPRGTVVVEFLNRLEIVAFIKFAGESLGICPPRVRTYSPFQVQRWLMKRGLRLVRRTGIYLPPRSFPKMGRVFERRSVTSALDRLPLVRLGGAHAFFFTAERS